MGGPIGKKEIVSAGIRLCPHEAGSSGLAGLVTCLLFPPDPHSEVDGGGWGAATGIPTPGWSCDFSLTMQLGVFCVPRRERGKTHEGRKQNTPRCPQNFVPGPHVAAGKAGMCCSSWHIAGFYLSGRGRTGPGWPPIQWLPQSENTIHHVRIGKNKNRAPGSFANCERTLRKLTGRPRENVGFCTKT